MDNILEQEDSDSFDDLDVEESKETKREPETNHPKDEVDLDSDNSQENIVQEMESQELEHLDEQETVVEELIIEPEDDQSHIIEHDDLQAEDVEEEDPLRNSPEEQALVEEDQYQSMEHHSIIETDMMGLLPDLPLAPTAPPKEIERRREGKSKKEIEEEEREKMQVLVSNFTSDQLDRYEMYRRSAFPKAAIKRLMQTIIGSSVSQNAVIAMSGISKVFVGEVVEEALDVMESQGESGALLPRHLREAVRRLRLKGVIPNGRARKQMFR